MHVSSAHVPTKQVSQALVHAGAVLSMRDRNNDPKSVISIDMRPLVLHTLEGLQRAGITRAVVALGENATQIEQAVTNARLNMLINFVFVPTSVWRNLANSIMFSRIAFPTDDPFLIVRADQLYDWRVLAKVANAPIDRDVEAVALIDTAGGTLDWASGAHCSSTCRNGQCNALAKVRRRSGENERTESGCRLVDDVGHRLQTFDAVVAGDLYAARPVLFEVLLQLSTDSIYVTTSDAMHELAMRGTLACVEVGELGCHWFGAKTITAVYRGVAAQASRSSTSKQEAEASLSSSPGPSSPGGVCEVIATQESPKVPRRRGQPQRSWQHVVAAARELLESSTYSSPPSSPLGPSAIRGSATSEQLLPLLTLGPRIGAGAHCEVRQAELGHALDGRPAAMGWIQGSYASNVPARLAVKVYKTGHSSDRTESTGSVMREVMWEVHVLRQIRHEHIVRLCDVSYEKCSNCCVIRVDPWTASCS